MQASHSTGRWRLENLAGQSILIQEPTEIPTGTEGALRMVKIQELRVMW